MCVEIENQIWYNSNLYDSDLQPFLSNETSIGDYWS